MTDTTDLPDGRDSAEPNRDGAQQDSAATVTAATRPRRRATSGGLSAKVLPELQALAAELGITGTGRMRKSQLIEAITAAQGGAGSTAAQGGVDAGSPSTQAPSEQPETSETPAAPARARRRASSAAGAASPAEAKAEAEPQDDVRPDAEAVDRSGDENGSEDDEDTGRTGNERVDRGRERFLEREARRQERAAAAAASGEDAPQGRDGRQDGRERTGRNGSDRTGNDRGNNDRNAGDREAARAGSDRAGSDRDGSRGGNDRDSRQEGNRDSGTRDGQGRQGQDDGPRQDEEDGGRRGRFRERGRGRNRNRGFERGGNDPDPVVDEDDVLVPIGGILDIGEGNAFVRTSGYLAGPNDVYVTLNQVRRYALRRGDAVTGQVRQQRDGERRDRYNALVRLDSVNGLEVEESRDRPEFAKLTPLHPQDRLRLETDPAALTTRVIDLVMPVGKGQRALIVSPPKAGKTVVLQAIANAISVNNPEVHLMVVLVDERPEEVTDMQRSVKGEVIASTFDRPPMDHITVAELSIERAKRLVELGHDVVVLLDSITRLGRAYNLGAPASGRILTGGVDSAALYPPKRFLGAARNIEDGGSLTIFATALVETGSAMDSVIFEEFKGTGNAELKLDGGLADKRIFPAIDVDASGTRKEELLLAPDELKIVLQLRKVLHAQDSGSSLERLLEKLGSTRTNVELLMQMQKTTASAGTKA